MVMVLTWCHQWERSPSKVCLFTSSVCRPRNNPRIEYGPTRPKKQRFVGYLNRSFHHDWPGPNSFIMKKLRFYNEYTWYDSLFCRELFHEQWKHPGFSLGQDINASFDFEHFEIASQEKCNPALGVFVGCMASSRQRMEETVSLRCEDETTP